MIWRHMRGLRHTHSALLKIRVACTAGGMQFARRLIMTPAPKTNRVMGRFPFVHKFPSGSRKAAGARGDWNGSSGAGMGHDPSGGVCVFSEGTGCCGTSHGKIAAWMGRPPREQAPGSGYPRKVMCPRTLHLLCEAKLAELPWSGRSAG